MTDKSKFLKSFDLNDQMTGVAGWYIPDEDMDICDNLILFHKTSDNVAPGRAGSNEVNENRKKSLDISFHPDQQPRYFNHLEDCIKKYRELYPQIDIADPWGIFPVINVQHYLPPDGGFPAWHCENGSLINSNRWLVFMTYLNDVPEGGETEFQIQNLKIKPQKGLTLIWSADWFFTHRGVPVTKYEKWIATGWYAILHPENSQRDYNKIEF